MPADRDTNYEQRSGSRQDYRHRGGYDPESDDWRGDDWQREGRGRGWYDQESGRSWGSGQDWPRDRTPQREWQRGASGDYEGWQDRERGGWARYGRGGEGGGYSGGYGEGGYGRRGTPGMQTPAWRREGRDYGSERFGGDSYGEAGRGMGGSASTYYGPYTGRGPRGYHRADERVCEDVCEMLSRHGGVDASDMAVHVEDGEVTLSGTARDRWQKRMAEDAVEDVPGVRDVHNELKVHTGGASAGGMGSMANQKGMTATGREMTGQQMISGQPVYALDGTMVGTVKDVEAGRFKVDAPMRPDYWLGRDAVASMGRDGVTLRANEGDLGQYRRDDA
ncbi:MAG: BON domain-containing protein [Dehalococcoidia bacterium]|nr:BON domain-containing protein [Dehalococcoidia bacterium]